MSKKTNDAISRSDRVLVAAMMIILATASAAIGASLSYTPSTDKAVAIKPEPPNETEHIQLVWMSPRRRVRPADATNFRTELLKLMEHIDKRWEGACVGALALAALDWLAFYTGGAATRNMWRFSRPLRPLFALAKLPRLRRLLASVARTLPFVAQAAALLGVFVAAFGLLGVQLFNREQ